MVGGMGLRPPPMTGYRRSVQRVGWRQRPGDGFGTPSINDLAALRQNRRDFESRLWEIGFFRDLSDAFVTQTIAPRYTISASDGRHA